MRCSSTAIAFASLALDLRILLLACCVGGGLDLAPSRTGLLLRWALVFSVVGLGGICALVSL